MNNNPLNRNPASFESILTIDDIVAAEKEYAGRRTAHFDRFPVLTAFTHQFCNRLKWELVLRQVPLHLAKSAAANANRLADVSAFAVHRSIWNAVLPNTGEGIKK